jgi:hypothetical protein
MFGTAAWNERQPWALGLTGWFGDLGIEPHTTVWVCRILEGTIVALFLAQAWRGTVRLGFAACLMTIASPRLNPWYAVSCIAFSALDGRDRTARLLVVAISIVMLADVLTPALDA